MKNLLVILFIFSPGILSLDLVEKIAKELKIYMHTGTHRTELSDAVSELRTAPNKTYQNEQMCATCQHVVNGVIQFRRAGVQRDQLSKLIKYLCVTFSDHGEIMCKSLVDTDIDALIYMMDHRKNMTSARVCSIYLQHRLCEDPDLNNWEIRIPERVGEIPKTVRKAVDLSPDQIVHLTDIHVDPDYTPGSDADCGKPLCCQKGSPKSPETAAGYWGDYHVCDMPWHSVVNLLERVKTQHSNLTYIYFTGDIIAHTWKTAKATNTRDISDLTSKFKQYFPGARVFPILGNHEAHPCDYYSPLGKVDLGELSTQWLFDLVSEEWGEWLPSDARKTLKKGGYYTVLVKEGFRIIGINSNVCFLYNLWLMEDDVDPYGQLQWLSDTLEQAERNGEVVHLLSHIPPGSVECWKVWMKNFNKIVRRFSDTIVAQFNGHTHLDEIRFFYDTTKSSIINVAYNGASFTTFIGNNPNYRVYDVDPRTQQVLDYRQYIYNLTEANIHGNKKNPNWYVLYSFKEAYGLNDTNMKSIYDLVNRMETDKDRTLLKEYRRFTVRDSDYLMKETCDDECLDKWMCTIVGVEFEDSVKCL